MTRLQTIAHYRELLDKAHRKGCGDEVERHLARNDLFYLLTVLLRRKDVNHDWLFARCREVERDPDGRLDLWAREHFKSTIITFGLTIRDILRDPEITVGIFSFNRPTAKKFLHQIKEEFEKNERLRALFPEIIWQNPHKDASVWNEEAFTVNRKSNPAVATVEAHGIVEGQPTGRHFKLMVYDDVVSVDSVTSSDMIEKTTRAWEASLNLGSEGGAVRYIGTRWHYNDTYRTIIDRGSAIERRHPVTYDGTVEGEPVLWTRERVAEKRRDQGPYTFASQMLLDPAADRTQGFRDDWVRYYIAKGDADYTNMNKYLIVDPASEKKKQSDYTAMVVLGLGDDQNFYLLDMIRDRLNLTERGDAVFSLHKRWRPMRVGYEKYGMQADIEYIKDRQNRENYRFEIVELGGRLGKLDRIRRMVPVFEAGRFHLPEALLKVDYEGRTFDLVQVFLNDEYRPFPVAIHDDMFDAIARIEDPEMSLVWPKPIIKEDRYAKPVVRRRPTSSWAA